MKSDFIYSYRLNFLNLLINIIALLLNNIEISYSIKIDFVLIFVSFYFQLILIIYFINKTFLKEIEDQISNFILIFGLLIIPIFINYAFIYLNIQIASVKVWFIVNLIMNLFIALNQNKIKFNFFFKYDNYTFKVLLLIWSPFVLLYMISYLLNPFKNVNLSITDDNIFFIFYITVIIIYLLSIILMINKSYLKTNNFIELNIIISTALLVKYGWLMYNFMIRSVNSLWLFGHVNYLVTTNSFDKTILWYFSWPGMFLSAAPLYLIINNPWWTILIFEIIIQIVVIYSLYHIFKIYLEDEIKRIVFPIFLILLQNLNIWYFTSSFFGYMIYLLIFYISLITFNNLSNNLKSKIYYIKILSIQSFLFITLLISHTGTLLFLISNIFFILIVVAYKNYRELQNVISYKIIIKNFRSILLYSILILIASILFISIFIYNLGGFNKVIFELMDSIKIENIITRLIPYFDSANRVIFQVLIFFMILVSTGIILIKVKIYSSKTKNSQIIYLQFIILLSMLSLILITNYGGSEFIEIRARIYVFSLLPILLIHAIHHKDKNYGILNLSIILIFLIISHSFIYYSYDTVYVTSEELEFTDNIYKSIIENNSKFLIVASRSNPIRTYINNKLEFMIIGPDETININTINSNYLKQNQLNNFDGLLFFWYEMDNKIKNEAFTLTYNNPIVLYNIYIEILNHSQYELYAESINSLAKVFIYAI